MRILYFMEAYGGSTFIANQIREVAKTEVVSVACCQLDSASKGIDAPLDFVRIIPRNSHPLLNRFFLKLENWDIYLNFANRNFSNQLKSLIGDFKPDIIHCQFGYDALILSDNHSAPHVKLVVSFRGFDASAKLASSVYRAKLKALLSHANVFPIFCGEHLKENLSKAAIPFHNENLVLHSGTNIAFFKRESRKHTRDPLTFLQISSFREKKGHAITLRAFQIFSKRNPRKRFKLILAGPHDKFSEFEGIKRLAIELGLQDKVEFPGWVSPSAARDLLERSHFFVHHSLTPSDGDQEGMPNALVEAMAMELPIVSSRHAAIPKFVTEGENGLLVEERDIEGYANALERVSDWPYLEANRKKAKELFSVSHQNLLLLQFYGRVLAIPPRQPQSADLPAASVSNTLAQKDE